MTLFTRTNITNGRKRFIKWIKVILPVALVTSLFVFPSFYEGNDRVSAYISYAKLTSLSSSLQTKSNQYKYLILNETEKRFGSPDLASYIIAQLVVESALNPKAYNKHSQACGIAQFIPSTHEWLKSLYPWLLKDWECTDSVTSIIASILYTSMNWERFNESVCEQIDLVMASYNTGPNRVARLLRQYGKDWRLKLPFETKAYIRAIKNLSKLYQTKGWRGYTCQT